MFPWPLRKPPLSSPGSTPIKIGIIWDIMGNSGGQWKIKVFPWIGGATAGALSWAAGVAGTERRVLAVGCDQPSWGKF